MGRPCDVLLNCASCVQSPPKAVLTNSKQVIECHELIACRAKILCYSLPQVDLLNCSVAPFATVDLLVSMMRRFSLLVVGAGKLSTVGAFCGWLVLFRFWLSGS